MENYAQSQPGGSFDVRWRHFQPRLSISSPQFNQSLHGPQIAAHATAYPLYAGGSQAQSHPSNQSSPTTLVCNTLADASYAYLSLVGLALIRIMTKCRFIQTLRHPLSSTAI